MTKSVLLSLPFVVLLAVACSGGGPGDVGANATRDGGVSGDGGGSDGAAQPDGAGRGDGGGPDGSSGGGCRSDTDCVSGFENLRFAPGESICGGAAPQKKCINDSSCADAGSDLICLFDSCDGSRCAPKCKTDADCPSQPAGLLVCEKSGRCNTKPCAPGGCPTHFECVNTGTTGCSRKACKTDAECTGGACVNSRCWPGPGTCSAPPA